MVILKPKDIAEKLNTKPEKVSKFASDIESAQLYLFAKTPLGSFQFQEDDVAILKEYADLMYFFNRKKEALEMLNHQIQENSMENKKRPSWSHLLLNAKFIE